MQSEAQIESWKGTSFPFKCNMPSAGLLDGLFSYMYMFFWTIDITNVHDMTHIELGQGLVQDMKIMEPGLAIAPSPGATNLPPPAILDRICFSMLASLVSCPY